MLPSSNVKKLGLIFRVVDISLRSVCFYHKPAKLIVIKSWYILQYLSHTILSNSLLDSLDVLNTDSLQIIYCLWFLNHNIFSFVLISFCLRVLMWNEYSTYVFVNRLNALTCCIERREERLWAILKWQKQRCKTDLSGENDMHTVLGKISL